MVWPLGKVRRYEARGDRDEGSLVPTEDGEVRFGLHSWCGHKHRSSRRCTLFADVERYINVANLAHEFAARQDENHRGLL